MDFVVLHRLIAEKLRDRSTYVVALVVGTLINLYGQFLVPWLRGVDDPLVAFADEFWLRPWLVLLSIFIAYAFPMCVGVYSAVAARYKNRRIESMAEFPERKPDPVFRAAWDGRMVEVGAATRAFFERYSIGHAQEILGEDLWQEIRAKREPGGGVTVFFAPESARYSVSHAPMPDGCVNVYLSRLPA